MTHYKLAAVLPDPALDRAERRQRRGPRQPPAGRGLIPANGLGETHARIGCALQQLPGGKEQKGVEPVPGNRLGVDEEARSALGRGPVPEGFRLGKLFERKDVEGSGVRGHGRLQSGIDEVRSARASIAPTRLSNTIRLPRTLRPPPSRRPRAHPGGPANLPARMSPRGSSPRSPAGPPVDCPESGEPR